MFGEWLSLVEHLVRDQGVGGSNPLSPTIKTSNINSLAKTSFPAKPELGSILLFTGFESLFERSYRSRR